MSDILVTSPFQPFTLPTQFKAVFNGYIYCGTVDAVDPSVSQVQAYLVNENGDKVPVAQPLRTNAGGYLVYNGQPAKFVTDSNHSLLVQDSLQVQVWYEPDVSRVDPDTIATILGLQAREALRRSYAEAGYKLVAGSFESGGAVSTVTDVLLYEAEGKAYSWGGSLPKTVLEGSTPTGTGGIGPSAWTDKSDRTNKQDLSVVSVFSYMTSAQVADVTSGTGAIDVTAAMQAAQLTGRPVRYPAGKYKISGAVSISNINMSMIGEAGTVFDLTGNTNDYPIDYIGSYSNLPALSANLVEKTRTITFVSAPGLVPGDVFVIYNPTPGSWSNFRPEYNAGEWCEVASVSGNTVTVKLPLYDNYTAAQVTVHKVTSGIVNISKIKVIGDVSTGQIRIGLGVKPSLKDVVTTNKNNSCVYFDRCYAPEAENCDLTNYGDGGDDYGLSIGNSQHARIRGGMFYARRHGVTHGGGSGPLNVPNRDCRTRFAIISNDQSSGVFAADFHGNTEDSSFEDCKIFGGATWQGKNNGYARCKITDDIGGRVIYSAEILGGLLYARDCDFIANTDPSTSSRGIVDVGGSSDVITSNTKQNVEIEVTGCSLNGRNLSATTSFVVMKNRGFAGFINFNIDKNNFDVNGLGQILFTQLISGTAQSFKVVVDGVTGAPAGTLLHNASGGAYSSFPHRLHKQVGKVTLTATSGTASAIASPITLRYPYPRVPAAAVGGVIDINGNLPTHVGLFSLTATHIRPMLSSGSTTNWTATVARDVSYTVVIDEV